MAIHPPPDVCMYVCMYVCICIVYKPLPPSSSSSPLLGLYRILYYIGRGEAEEGGGVNMGQLEFGISLPGGINSYDPFILRPSNIHMFKFNFNNYNSNLQFRICLYLVFTTCGTYYGVTDIVENYTPVAVGIDTVGRNGGGGSLMIARILYM